MAVRRMLFKRLFQKSRVSMAAVFLMTLFSGALIPATLALQNASAVYLREELDRLSYGDLAALVSGEDTDKRLLQQMELLEETERVEAERLVLADYLTNKIDSDSEGLFMVYDPVRFAYRFLSENARSGMPAADVIQEDAVYVPASFVSLYGTKIGDEIRMRIGRGDLFHTLTVAGFYEDPVFGSTMIGRKRMLVAEETYLAVLAETKALQTDALAREGAMLHIFLNEGSNLRIADANALLLRKTTLADYLEEMDSRETIIGMMLLLQNIFSIFLLALAAVFAVTAFFLVSAVLNHVLEEDRLQAARLCLTGVSEDMLRKTVFRLFAIPLLLGIGIGILLAVPLTRLLFTMTVQTTGILPPVRMPVSLIVLLFTGILAIQFLFIIRRTKKTDGTQIARILRDEGASQNVRAVNGPKSRKGMAFHLSVRKLKTGTRYYAGALVTALLLTFFVSFIGSLNAWLGDGGEGMMEAFNPADHDLGVQTFGNVPQKEIEDAIRSSSEITGRYALAMPTLNIGGLSCTANVITDASLFHMLQGESCMEENEIVLTRQLASDLGVQIGDTVTVSNQFRQAQFTVSGIYQCANDLGMNFGMNTEGYLSIAKNDPDIWCVHYFLEDSAKKTEIADALSVVYGDRIHVHENTWPGLFSILSAMRALIIGVYVLALLFILIAVSSTGRRILFEEERELSILKLIGCDTDILRTSFALRFLLVSCCGGIAGSLLSLLLSERITAPLMRFAGIGDYHTHAGAAAVMVPVLMMVLFFTCAAYWYAGKIKHVRKLW